MKKKMSRCRFYQRKEIMVWTLKILLVCFIVVLWTGQVCAGLLDPREWQEGEISTVKTNIDDIWTTLQPNGDIRTIAQDLREQLKKWEPYKGNTELLTQTVEDILGWLVNRTDDYINFNGGNLSNKCPSSSDCGIFKADMIGFFKDISALPPEIEVIQRLGFRDAGIAEKIINFMPPIILFGMYERFKHIKNWQSIPADINNIFFEIDDPEAFSLQLYDEETNVIAITNTVGPLDRTKTQRFCRLRAYRLDSDRKFDGVDPVRLNRLDMILSNIEEFLSSSCDWAPDDLNLTGTVVGEGAGTAFPSPSKILLCYSAAIPNIIAKAIETHRANIGLCMDRFAEIEDRLASCSFYSDFTLDKAANEEYYDLVLRRLDSAFKAGIPTSQSIKEYNSSKIFLTNGVYATAFQLLCKSYTKIGIGDICDPDLATNETNPVECKAQ